jgi:hypothetical protein
MIKVWIYVAVVIVLAAGIYAFIELTGARTRWMNRHSARTAESMYDNYADSRRKQRRYAREHGGEWRDGQPAWLPSPARPAAAVNWA